MITNIAKKIVDDLWANGIVEKNDMDVYQYGFFLLLSHALYFFEVILFGIIFDVVLEGIVFYFFFNALRNYSGGFHARKEITCIFCTTFAMLLSVLAIRLLEYVESGLIHGVILLCGAVAIFTFSPLDTIEKPLDKRERKHFRRKSIVI